MEVIRNNIIKLGDEKDLNALHEYVSNIDIKDLTSFLNKYIGNQNGLLIWKYLLHSFNDSPESHEKRFQISKFIINFTDEKCVPDSIGNDLIFRLIIELTKFKSSHLIAISNICIDKIRNGNVSAKWKDILPEVLSILAEKTVVTFNNTDMSGMEFKNQVINSLCFMNWSKEIITVLVTVFRDISLTKEEHFQIVCKLSQCMENLTCQEIPAFIYQLLKLCSKQNSRIIFLALQNYFSRRIYKNLGQSYLPSSDTTDFDEITDVCELDAVQVESTVLYYIHESATLGNGSIKEYINSLKSITKAPEFILHPFQLTILLTISSVMIYEEQTIDIIRTCIVRIINEDAKKNDTAWFRNIISSPSKTSNIISAVLENNIKERPYVAVGLINLSFVLLSAGAGLGMKNVAEAQWQLGMFILLKLMKKYDQVSSTVIKKLCNKIVVGENITHMAECLFQMCKNLTLIMFENQGNIIQLIEETLQLPGSSSMLIVEAIMPLLKISCTIRENLILLLRKALYARETEVRKMAVNGYLKLLKSLRVSNLTAMSQTNSSVTNYSFLTQVSLENHVQRSQNQFSNEAVCLAILEILKRCFMQQSEVKDELYEGLYSAVCLNAELGIPVLKMLLSHFNQYHCNEEVLPPLDFSKIFIRKNDEVILQEPLGHLIYILGLILTKVKETHDHSDPNLMRTSAIMESLCEQMAKCELVHFNLDSGRDIFDDLPECQIDLITLKHAMSVYEALMGYLICTWNVSHENMAQKIYSLFQVYCRLVDFSKNSNKVKKIDGKKKTKDELKNKGTLLLKAKMFKPIKTVMDFQTSGKILSLLYEPRVNWTDTSQSNILKVKCEFHRYVLNIVFQLVMYLKSSKCIESIHTKPYFNYCTEIATVLYERIIKRLSYVMDFDLTSAVLGVECFYLILNLIVIHYKEKINYFLTTISAKNKDEELNELLFSFIKVFHEFFEKDEGEYYSDTEGKKLQILLANIYTILVEQLPHHGSHNSEVLEWLKIYTNENVLCNKQVGNIFVNVLLNLNMRIKEESGLYENIAIKLCDVVGTITNDTPECPVHLKIINESTVLTALNSLANILKIMLNEADWIIQRCKAEYCVIMYPGADKVERRKELLKIKERDLCCHVCRIVNICTCISNMNVPPGMNAEIVFKLLMQMYNVLNNLTKYYVLISSKINPAFQSARFERLLKLAGKPLSNTVYSFILYIEQGAGPEEAPTQPKKKLSNPNTMKTKILRETRLIPKLVYEMEQFSRNVITLSNKTKIDLTKYVGLGTVRDYRIKTPALKEALDEIEESFNEMETNDEVSDIQNETTEDTNMEVEEQEDNCSPPEKRSRQS